MAELVVARITLKLAWRLFAPQAASMLEQGDIAEEKLRQLLLTEFNKIHEQLHALRRKELVAAMAFLETGFEVLKKDEVTAKDEFRKARDAAQMAFGVVADASDKVLATKILITSTFNEFNDNLDTAKSLCLKYLERMNTLPEVVRACEMIFAPQESFGSKLLSKSGKTKREGMLKGVAEINKCAWDYFAEHLKTEMSPAPVIRFNSYHINPVTDMILHRSPVLVAELEKSLSGFVSVCMTEKYIFAALSQITGDLVANDIIAINLKLCRITHLMGHQKLVLTVCSNESYLVSGSYDKNILVWNIQTLQPVKTLSGHTGSVRSVCLSEQYIFSGSSDCTVRLWDITNDFEHKQTLDIMQPVIKVTCSQRKFLFCLNGMNNVQIWDINKLAKLHETNTIGQAFNIVANDNLMYIPTKTKEGETIQCWNLGSLTAVSGIMESGANLVKYYNSPYIFCGNEKIRMVSTSSQRLIMEEEVIIKRGMLVGRKIKQMWMSRYQLFALCETESGKNFIVRY